MPTPTNSSQNQRIDALEKRMDRYDAILEGLGHNEEEIARHMDKVDVLLEQSNKHGERTDKILDEQRVINTTYGNVLTGLTEQIKNLRGWTVAAISTCSLVGGALITLLFTHLIH